MTQEVEEQAKKTKKLDFQQYAAALEHILVIANRLQCRKKLQETCKECPLIAEIDTLQILARDESIAQIEKQLGYTMKSP